MSQWPISKMYSWRLIRSSLQISSVISRDSMIVVLLAMSVANSMRKMSTKSNLQSRLVTRRASHNRTTLWTLLSTRETMKWTHLMSRILSEDQAVFAHALRVVPNALSCIREIGAVFSALSSSHWPLCSSVCGSAMDHPRLHNPHLVTSALAGIPTNREFWWTWTQYS